MSMLSSLFLVIVVKLCFEIVLPKKGKGNKIMKTKSNPIIELTVGHLALKCFDHKERINCFNTNEQLPNPSVLRASTTVNHKWQLNLN